MSYYLQLLKRRCPLRCCNRLWQVQMSLNEDMTFFINCYSVVRSFVERHLRLSQWSKCDIKGWTEASSFSTNLLLNLIPISVTRLSNFWKVLATKRSPNDWQLFGLFWKTWLLCQNSIGYFLGKFLEKIGLLFSPPSGHTDPNDKGIKIRFISVRRDARFFPETWRKFLCHHRRRQRRRQTWSGRERSLRRRSLPVDRMPKNSRLGDPSRWMRRLRRQRNELRRDERICARVDCQSSGIKLHSRHNGSRQKQKYSHLRDGQIAKLYRCNDSQRGK